MFGLSAAIVLADRGFDLAIVDPTGPSPHALAASRDISKVVRSEYGGDLDYTRLARQAMEGWRAWNSKWGDIYHECGIAWLSAAGSQSVHGVRSLETAGKLGIDVLTLDRTEIRRRFPMVNTDAVTGGFFNPGGGFVEARKALEHMRSELTNAGTRWLLGRLVKGLLVEGGECKGVRLDDGSRLEGAQVLVAAGAWSGAVVPELKSMATSTAQPIFHLHVSDRERYQASRCSVIMPDMEKSGLYILPLHPEEGVVKAGLHTRGRFADPVQSDRIVLQREVRHLRSQLAVYVPELASAPIVHSRICLYHDTRDQDFVIDAHPDVSGLFVACGGSGHGFKFAPILGDITASRMLGESHPFAARFEWRKPPDAVYGLEQERAELLDL